MILLHCYNVSCNYCFTFPIEIEERASTIFSYFFISSNKNETNEAIKNKNMEAIGNRLGPLKTFLNYEVLLTSSGQTV